MQLFYGIDLRVAVDEETPRRLWALIQGLPPEAAVWRDLPASWTSTHELLALLVEIGSQGQVKVPRPGAESKPAGGNVVSIAQFVQDKSKHRKGGE